VGPSSYAELEYWRKYLPFLPEIMRLPRDPDEEWWEWGDSQVHLDRLDAPDAALKVIVLHGGGGNGRLVGAFGALVHKLGYSYVAPDLPGFGLTVAGPDYDPDYRSWVALVADLLVREQERDGLPVVLMGGSLGGMLAYNAAAASRAAVGVIATTLADPRDEDARDALARSKLWSRLGYAIMNALPGLSGRLDIPAKSISRLEWITNDPAFSQIFIDDPLVGRARINLDFYRSMTVYEPPIAPEAFDVCPLLLVHPADDKWTPFVVSQPFYDRLSGEKQLVLLEGCGHFPYEEPGVSQLREAVEVFLRKRVP
jgi:alpha-beta hydrolase superfamily lysophospholipase